MGILSRYFQSNFDIHADQDAINFAESVTEIAAIVTGAEQRAAADAHDSQSDSLFAAQMEKLRQHALDAAVNLSLHDMGLLIHRAKAMQLATSLDNMLYKTGLDLYADDAPLDVNAAINLGSAHDNVMHFIADLKKQAAQLQDAPALLALTQMEGDSIWTRSAFPGDAKRSEISDGFTSMRDALIAASGTLAATAVAVLKEQEPAAVSAITGEEAAPVTPAAATGPKSPGA